MKVIGLGCQEEHVEARWRKALALSHVDFGWFSKQDGKPLEGIKRSHVLSFICVL